MIVKSSFLYLVILCGVFHRTVTAIHIENADPDSERDQNDPPDEDIKPDQVIHETKVNKRSAGTELVHSRSERSKDINCDNFSDYALNCTMNAAIMYNSNRKSPPMPKKIKDWCKAVKYLTNCALEWNMDCRDVTDSHFNEESINGHSFVVHNICDDKSYLEEYMDLAICVDNTADQWEECYTTFKLLVDGYKKNTSYDWTHYETHFFLCCGRARFRRCVLDTVFKRSDVCTRAQAVKLQKFSVIVSEGDVYQDCEFNMMYSNCPGGDPRPTYNNLGLNQLGQLEQDRDTYDRLSDSACRPYLHPALPLLLYAIIHIHTYIRTFISSPFYNTVP